ncbi:MAG: carboxypeptidase-like regulatory domain-containing protein [Bacteroidales bacterium]|nr:carboxypeptidase-like regulatory domain-containing protein [Bacteroidales bacterium]
MLRIVFIFSCLLFSIISYSQQTKVRGRITDAETKEEIPFVNVSFKGTTTGTITDFKGEYFLQTRIPVDTLIVSYIGYKTQSFQLKKNYFQVIDIELVSENINLEEVIIKPGENPAHRIIRNIISNKANNNPEKFRTIQYEAYSKIELDINNIDDDFKKNKAFKHFQFVFDYVDTSVVTGKPFLPIFITETLSDVYLQKEPNRKREIIKATKMSGIENESVMQYTGQMYQYVDVYENFIQIFGKGFVSPIANSCLFYYKYYLIDSAFIDNLWCYQISFKPKRKQEPTFTGDFWVNDTTFAIKKINVRMAEDANINFVKDLVASYEYQKVDNDSWYLKKDELLIDFNIAKKTFGFFGKKTTSYKNIIIDKPANKEFFSKNTFDETTILKDALCKNNDFWQSKRHEKLSEKEESIYVMVDSIKEVPIFRTFVDFFVMFTTGYYVHKNFEFGPYYTFFSFNPIEGNRIKIGGRTSNDFSTKIMYFGHLAYGIEDEKFKYGLGTMYMFSKNPRISAGISYNYDMEQLGQSQNAFLQDNILASVLRREYNYKLTIVREYNGFYEKEWYQGFSNKLTISHRTIYSTDYIPFIEIQNQKEYDYLTSFEIILNTRFAYNEKFLLGEFERISLGTRFPILNLNFTFCPENILESDYQYYKLNFNIEHKFNINPFGNLMYIIDAGKYWGKAPYPFLQLHEGNETYAYDDYAFNMMNYYEFVSDEYASIYLEHHFEGLFLNHFPLFRKLKWREVVAGKTLVGKISKNNRDILMFPGTLTGLSVPYYETSVGIENILNIFRVDAMWRLSYLNKPDVPDFGIRVKMEVDF